MHCHGQRHLEFPEWRVNFERHYRDNTQALPSPSWPRLERAHGATSDQEE